MDLLSRSILTAVVIIAIVFVIFYALQNNLLFTQHVSKQQAEALVTNDLMNSYQGAVINITNVTTSQYPGSWHIVTSVVINATKACPSYFIYSFDYPQYGFVYRVENNYTSNCVIYGFIQNRSYIIASYPVAIARATSLNLTSVHTYLNTFGYKNVDVTANYYNSTIVNGTAYTNVWLVKYSASQTDHVVDVLLTQSQGNLLYVTNQST